MTLVGIRLALGSALARKMLCWLPFVLLIAVCMIGVCISVPAIIAYTVFSYRVFWGKATELRYG